MKHKEHENNTYAYNVKWEVKHVSEVNRGRKGYFCMGCEAEMEARKGEVRSHYFAHIPTDVEIERKCIYSDETYRHKLAKEILQRIKKVKVPPVYKYPPPGIDGMVNKLQDSRFIVAHSVKNERQFYEDESGEIQYGQNIDFKKDQGKHLLIQPDVVFFDKKGNPILLIEVVATHKIDQAKLSKIRRLAIDTIQVVIPKDSPEAIENVFFVTQKTQWVYNHEQETTPYIHISQGNTKGIPPLDEFQKKLLKTAESYACRSSQINNLIRGLRKCLGSKYYRRSERRLRSELARVEENTERNSLRLQELQNSYEEKIRERLSMEDETLRAEENELDQREKEFQQNCTNLEERYRKKKAEIEEIQDSYQPECLEEIEQLERQMADLEERGTNFDEQIAELGNEEGNLQRAIDELDQRRLGLPEKYRLLEEELRRDLERKTRNFEEESQRTRARMRRELKRDRERITQAIEGRVTSGDSSTHRRIKETISYQQILVSITEKQGRIRTLDEVKSLLRSGAYKDWV